MADVVKPGKLTKENMSGLLEDLLRTNSIVNNPLGFYIIRMAVDNPIYTRKVVTLSNITDAVASLSKKDKNIILVYYTHNKSKKLLAKYCQSCADLQDEAPGQLLTNAMESLGKEVDTIIMGPKGLKENNDLIDAYKHTPNMYLGKDFSVTPVSQSEENLGYSGIDSDVNNPEKPIGISMFRAAVDASQKKPADWLFRRGYDIYTYAEKVTSTLAELPSNARTIIKVTKGIEHILNGCPSAVKFVCLKYYRDKKEVPVIAKELNTTASEVVRLINIGLQTVMRRARYCILGVDVAGVPAPAVRAHITCLNLSVPVLNILLKHNMTTVQSILDRISKYEDSDTEWYETIKNLGEAKAKNIECALSEEGYLTSQL